MRGNESQGYFDLGLLQVSFDGWSHDASVAPKFIRAKPGQEDRYSHSNFTQEKGQI